MDTVPTSGAIIVNVNGSDRSGLGVDNWGTLASTYVHLSIYVAYYLHKRFKEMRKKIEDAKNDVNSEVMDEVYKMKAEESKAKGFLV